MKKKHALVVGSQTGGLSGPIGDAQRIAAVLSDDGFEVDLRTTDAAASRQGIIAGYKKLVENTDGEAAVFYYSGHGVRVLPHTSPPADARRSYQAIVPTDFERSTEERFLGIADVELSTMLAQLTKKTKNATVILDCCHSAAMSRDVESRPKSLTNPRYVDVQRHVSRVLEEDQLPIDLLAATGNPDAVRLVAAGESQSAYERYVVDRMVGTFTESLVLALREAKGQRVTWEAIGRFVRERVLGIHAMQRADVEGPSRRYVFEREEAPPSGTVGIVTAPNGVFLRAGRVQGVREGDEYACLPADANPSEAARTIATATVTRVENTRAAVTIVPPAAELPPGTQAVQTKSAAPRRSIRLNATGAARIPITAAIEARGRFRVEEDPAADVFATVTRDDRGLEIAGFEGSSAIPDTDVGRARLVGNLEAMTAAKSLRDLRSANLPDTALEVTLGRVEAGKLVELASSGEVLAVGTPVTVRVRNTHPAKKKLYVSIFDIGLAQRIAQVTTDYAAGYELDYGETFTLGQDAAGVLQGIRLGWSDQLPQDGIRSETVVVIAAEQASHLGSLESGGMKGVTRSGHINALEQLVGQVQEGRPITRDLGTPAVSDGYVVRHLDFEVCPWPLPAASGAEFAIDHLPPLSTRLVQPRGANPSSGKIAIRVDGITIHDVKTLFGGAGDVRVDTLVITRQSSKSEPYRAATWRFKDIKDGDTLPLQNALAYHGDVRDFVDLRVWISRDRDDSKDLAELINTQANTSEFKTAAAALLAVTTAAAAGAPIVAALGATATLTAVAWRVLSQALPRSIGLYQTSLLAGEGKGFGEGRHPANGMYRVQNFSFAYTVTRV